MTTAQDAAHFRAILNRAKSAGETHGTIEPMVENHVVDFEAGRHHLVAANYKINKLIGSYTAHSSAVGGATTELTCSNPYRSGTSLTSITETAYDQCVLLEGNGYFVLKGQGSAYGVALAKGDLNGDGYEDIAIGETAYSGNTGRVYVFYGAASGLTDIDLSDGGSADVTITGEGANDYFGETLAIGNVDGTDGDDLIVGAFRRGSNAGKVYVFRGSALTTSMTTANAVATITGDSQFGRSLAVGAVDANEGDDLIVSATSYSGGTGRLYIFSGGGSLSGDLTASSDNVATMTGESSNNFFGYSLAVAAVDANEGVDLIVSAYGYSSSTGRVYIFSGGSLSGDLAADDADITITGEGNRFGYDIEVGAVDANEGVDLIVGAYDYLSFGTKKLYIFSGGNLSEDLTASNDAVATITISNPSFSGDTAAMAVGAVDANEGVDIIVGEWFDSSFKGKVHIFSGGSLSGSLTIDDADITIIGRESNDQLGYSLVTLDMNNDGYTDLAIGADGAWSDNGAAFVFLGSAAGLEDTTVADPF